MQKNGCYFATITKKRPCLSKIGYVTVLLYRNILYSKKYEILYEILYEFLYELKLELLRIYVIWLCDFYIT